jgi:hypothetical protein
MLFREYTSYVDRQCIPSVANEIISETAGKKENKIRGIGLIKPV